MGKSNGCCCWWPPSLCHDPRVSNPRKVSSGALWVVCAECHECNPNTSVSVSVVMQVEKNHKILAKSAIGAGLVVCSASWRAHSWGIKEHWGTYIITDPIVLSDKRPFLGRLCCKWRVGLRKVRCRCTKLWIGNILEARNFWKVWVDMCFGRSGVTKVIPWQQGKKDAIWKRGFFWFEVLVWSEVYSDMFKVTDGLWCGTNYLFMNISAELLDLSHFGLKPLRNW